MTSHRLIVGGTNFDYPCETPLMGGGLYAQLVDQLRTLMQTYEVTQVELSRRSGVPQGNISGILAGKRPGTTLATWDALLAATRAAGPLSRPTGPSLRRKMPRPSQCPACGCFEACLAPGAQGCAEKPVPTALEAIEGFCKSALEDKALPEQGKWIASAVLDIIREHK